MATIETQFNLIDRMSSPLMKINSVLELVVNQMQSVDTASNFGFKNKAINSTNECLVAVNQNIENINNKAISIKSNTNNTNEVASTIGGLQNKLDSLNNTPVGVSNVDTSSLNNLSQAIDNINNTPIELKSNNLSTNETTSNISNLQNQIDSLNNTQVKIANVDTSSLNGVEQTIDSINGAPISIQTNINGIGEVNSSIGNIQNKVESINGTPIEVTSKFNSINNVTNGLDKVQNSINGINKTPINVTTGLNKSIASTNEFSSSLVGVKSIISSIVKSPIKLTADISNLVKAKSTLKEINSFFNANESALNKNNHAQEEWNNSACKCASIYGKLAGLVKSFFSLMGAKQIIDLSDTISQNDARLSLIVDDNNTIDTLNEKIFNASQNARADYLTMSSMVASIGARASDAFTNNDEVIAFTEQLSKMYAIAGASSEEMASSMLQLTQALGSGVLRGDELNSVFEASPNIIQQIADYMGISIGEIRDLASEGLISAEIVKNAMLSATAYDYTSSFDDMPKTFSQIFTQIKNEAILSFTPIFNKLSEIANSERFNYFVSATIVALQYLSTVAINIFDELITAGNYLYDNWSTIAPIITNVAMALGILVVIYKTITAVTTIVTVAQSLYNAALWKCPIVWIIAGIVAIIVVINLVISAINNVTGSTISATGLIVGIISVAVAFIRNLFSAFWNFVLEGLVRSYNLFAVFGNFIGNVFNDPVSATIRLFYNMFDIILSIIQSCASALDMVFGTNLANGLQSWRNNMKNGLDNLIGEETIYFEYITGDDLKLDRIEYGQAYQNGYNFVDNIEQTVTGIFDMSSVEGIGDYTNNLEFPEVPDYSSLSNLEYLDELNNASSFPEIPEEDLKYLRDIAEREVINRFTTAQVNVDLGGVTNNVSNNNDLDGIIDYLATGVDEAMQKTANGVYV